MSLTQRCSLGEVTQSASRTTSRGVTIVNSSHLEQLLWNWGRNDASSTRCGDESHPDRSTLASNLARDGVRTTDLVSPETTSDWNNGKLGQDNSSSDGSCHLLGALDTKSNMSVVVSNGNESLESCSLTGSGLLLDRHDLEYLILKCWSNEFVNDLMLFDGERVKIDLLKALDLLFLDKTSQFSHRDPFLVFLSPATATTTSSSASTSSTTTTSVAETPSESSSSTITGWSCVRHVIFLSFSRSESS